MTTWLLHLDLLVDLAWRVTLERREGSYTLWKTTICEGRPSYARVCLFYSLSVSTWYRPIEDCCIYSYEAHLNIKEEFILGFSLERVSPKKTLSLDYALYFTIHFYYWLYTCSLVNTLGYTIYCSVK